MATVTKDFRIKSGLVVEGTNATVNGSDIITEDAITGGTQTNIAVTYNPVTKTVNFVAENGVADSNTDQLAEGTTNLYFTNERAQDAIGTAIAAGTQNGISVTYDDANNKLDFNVNDPTITIAGDVDGSATMTNLGNTTINVTLDTVNSAVGTYGSSTEIPVVTVNAKGLVTNVSTSSISTTLGIAGDTGTDNVSLGADTLTFSGGEGIDVAVTNNTVTIAAEDASTSNKGVASFDTDNFTVTSGAVSTKTATIGTSTIDLGSTTSSLAGLQSIDVDNISIDGNTISSTDTNGDIHLSPNGTGVVNVNSSRISGVLTPDASTDAANKAYVDSVAEGLHIHASVVAATTGNVNISTNLEPGDLVDGVTLAEGNRVLVKSQTNAEENGIYVVQTSGAALRAADFDAPAEVDGGDFVFVTGGNTYDNTGWVQTSTSVVTIGVDPIQFTQFSGAGTYTAGTGLDLNGTEFVLDLSEVDTNSLPEGNTNLYYTDERVDDRVNDLLIAGTGISKVYDDNTPGSLTLAVDFAEFDTDDVSEGTTNLYFTDQRAFDAVDGSSTINFVEVELNSIAKQVAATHTTTGGSAETVYTFSSANYRSGKFLVKLARGTHTEVSEILLTLDTSDNIAITEYAIVGTNGSLGTISATHNGIANTVSITVNTPSATTVKVVGTIIE